jgi:arylsulfatase A
MMLPRRIVCLFLLLTVVSCGASTAAEKPPVAKRPPNILLIMIDDLGWSDLHCQGNKRLDTPHLDRLATQGMRFTDAYAAAPVCSPTRAAILTGQSPARIGLTNHISNRKFLPANAKVLPAETLMYLPLEHVTIAERLKKAGYRTAMLGKWHLAGMPRREGRGLVEFYPEKQGFDINLGGCAHGGPPTFFDPYKIHTLPNRREGEYLPYRLADEAIKLMSKKDDKPFFLALWNYTVHWPMEAPKELIAKYKSRIGYGVKDARYAAMIEAMDKSMGQIFSALDRLKLADNTLVIFTSDNGGFSGVADNRPLRSGKGFLYEGGIRVPMIVRWPGVVKPGTLCKVPVVSTDLPVTIAAAVGLPAETKLPLDGESLLPLLRQSGKLKRDTLFFHYPNYAWHRSNRLGSAIRQGPHKLIEYFDDGTVELYNVEEDLSERKNLASSQPELAARLTKRLHAWRAETGAKLPTPVKKK